MGDKILKAARSLEVRPDEHGVVRFRIANITDGKDIIVQNIESMLSQMVAKRPSGAKMPYWQHLRISAEGLPALRIDKNDLPISNRGKRLVAYFLVETTGHRC